MAPNRGIKNKNQNGSYLSNMTNLFTKYFNFKTLVEIFMNPSYTFVIASLLLLFEAVLNIWIIERVKYTEIDWIAYMQEVEGFLNGTYHYDQLKGDTGPLVYPAGFVYIFSALYYITDKGTNIKRAQYIFAALYILTLALVFRLYNRSKKVPPFMLVFLCLFSYRIHSIYVLRLFNDPVAMIFLYASLNLFTDGWWTFGSLLFSIAVSIKMNILLFAPALLHIYLTSLGFMGTFLQLSVCGGTQVLLALPFLLTNPKAYLLGAFNLGRVFLYKWTVNWKMLSEEMFLNKHFHLSLLVIHIFLLCLFAFFVWHVCLQSYKKLKEYNMAVSCQLLLLPLFTSNFIGIAVSRSLHYQFYIWYFHTIPYLLYCTSMSTVYKLLLMGLIEMCWNTYPATALSSSALNVCHLVLLLGIFFNRTTKQSTDKMNQSIKSKSS